MDIRVDAEGDEVANPIDSTAEKVESGTEISDRGGSEGLDGGEYRFRFGNGDGVGGLDG